LGEKADSRPVLFSPPGEEKKKKGGGGGGRRGGGGKVKVGGFYWLYGRFGAALSSTIDWGKEKRKKKRKSRGAERVTHSCAKKLVEDLLSNSSQGKKEEKEKGGGRGKGKKKGRGVAGGYQKPYEFGTLRPSLPISV